MSNSSMLTMIVVFLVFLLIILIFCYFVIPDKSKVKENKKNNQKNKNNTVPSNKSEYNIQSIFEFMDFEKIEDNMIVQRKGKRFLMIVECQGVNYDLMSDIEKNAVESGFIGFLNSLKNPIQIHIQTRTINLENSINGYKDRLKKIEDELIEQQEQYKQMQKSGNYANKQLQNKNLEIMRLNNLYAYGKDIVRNTEAMSLNKNILRKKYYIIISYYYSSNDGEELLTVDEIKDVAFSELYTKCQSMIRVLSTTGVKGRVLNSYELADLLYNAYNRDSSETFGLDKAIDSGYDELYATSPDIMEKKMNTINKVIEDKAVELVEKAVVKSNEKIRQAVEEKEKNLNDLVNELAQSIILENAEALGDELAQESLEYVKKNKKESKGKEADVDGQTKKERKTRTTKKQ